MKQCVSDEQLHRYLEADRWMGAERNLAMDLQDARAEIERLKRELAEANGKPSFNFDSGWIFWPSVRERGEE